MCDNTVIPAPTAAQARPVTEDGNYVVVRDVTPEALHIKGHYDDIAAAHAKAIELEAAGYSAAIVFIPNTPVGDVDHGSGRKVINIPLNAPTCPVVVLSD